MSCVRVKALTGPNTRRRGSVVVQLAPESLAFGSDRVMQENLSLAFVETSGRRNLKPQDCELVHEPLNGVHTRCQTRNTVSFRLMREPPANRLHRPQSIQTLPRSHFGYPSLQSTTRIVDWMILAREWKRELELGRRRRNKLRVREPSEEAIGRGAPHAKLNTGWRYERTGVKPDQWMQCKTCAGVEVEVFCVVLRRW